MTLREFGEIKDLWKLIQAEVAIQQVINSAMYILANNLDADDPLYHPLLAAIYTLYARAFTDNRYIGMLSEDIVPEHSKAIHKEMISLRHGMFAHSATHNLKTDKFGPVLQAWFTFSGESAPTMFTTSIELPREKLEILHRYFMRMEHLIHEKMVARLNLYAPQRPKQDGDYILNIYDVNGPVWITHAESLKLLPPDATLLNIVLPPTD